MVKKETERETVLVLRGADGSETQRWRVAVFVDWEKETLGVRFLEGEWLKNAEAILPVSVVTDAVEKPPSKGKA